MPLRANALLFDLDGVLADSTANVERHWSEWARRVGLDPAELLPIVHGRRAIDTIRGVRPELDAERELAELVRQESTDTRGIVALPGAADLLAQLPDDAWAVVTSGVRAVALARLRAAGLRVPSALVTADAITRGKPDPEGYLEGARRLGVPPAECVVVEDAPAGAQAARNAGMQLLALTTTHDAGALEPAALVVPDLSHVWVRVTGHGALRVEIGSAERAA